MRPLRLMLAALLVVSCNSILGNRDLHLVTVDGGAGADAGAGAQKCRLNTDCTGSAVCIFQTCGPACVGDSDCGMGSRCLKTDTGTACVSSTVATCAAGCPNGTTCSPTDGVCRNACDTTDCLAGQTCTAGLCVSTDAHENGAGGGGGMSGGGGTGGTENAGTGGKPGGTAGTGGASADLCLGKVCDTPPANDCDSGTEFKSHDKTGSCAAGVCSYTPHVIPCTCQNHACTTDPCIGVACNMPPAAICTDMSTRTRYAATGTCSAGSCSYATTNTDCPFGCASGACKADPCAGVTCASPPATICKDVKTVATYATSGTCNAGACSYAATTTACGSNQQCGGAGVCSVCKSDTSCGASCGACGGGTLKCKDLGTTSQCVACLSNADCSGATPACNTTTNTCAAQPSCIGLGATCGPNGTSDCCASGVVTGGTFNRDNDTNYQATVSDFRLDNYEITVGRFRKFWAGYPGNMPATGNGKNPNNGSDPGWDATWNTSSLPLSQAALTTDIQCVAPYQTWTAGNDSLAMNCIDWFEAEAFCIWDGGRLPTEAEWNYAAAGGTQQRIYPWGSAAPDCTYANFGGASYPTSACVAPGTGPVNRVGSESPKGDGLYGQADLAGNVWEWVQDWYVSPYTNPCNNCANMTVSSYRVLRGGGFSGGASGLLSSSRVRYAPFDRGGGSVSVGVVGARCARGPDPG